MYVFFILSYVVLVEAVEVHIAFWFHLSHYRERNQCRIVHLVNSQPVFICLLLSWLFHATINLNIGLCKHRIRCFSNFIRFPGSCKNLVNFSINYVLVLVNRGRTLCKLNHILWQSVLLTYLPSFYFTLMVHPFVHESGNMFFMWVFKLIITSDYVYQFVQNIPCTLLVILQGVLNLLP